MLMASIPIYAVLLFLSCSFSSMHLCASSNRLVPGKPLTPNHTLVSDDGVFALGFFSPSNSTKRHYYVGIWYNNIPEHTVVWIANRAIPITYHSSAMLALNNSSDLVLSDGNGHVIWMSNSRTVVNSSPATTIAAEAILQNTGNFIVRLLSNNTILWQSFDHPTDTLLLGMNLRISHKIQPLQHLVSWKGQEDPSPGAFSYGADPNNLLQRFIWNGTKLLRRIPVWTSYFLIGSYMDSLHSAIYMAVHRGTDDEVYMSFGMQIESSSLIRMKVDYLGKVTILRWKRNMSVWESLYTEPGHECNKYAYCGPYGYCDNNGTSPTCKCLDGFGPKDDEGWVKGKFLQGCIRKKVLRCSSGDAFLNLPGMKVPDHFLHLRNRSFNDCESECRRNCSCVAYAYANMSTRAIDGDDTRCIIWTGMLIDMEKSRQGGESLYIRVNKLNGNKRTNILEIVLPVVASFLAFLSIGFIWSFWFRGNQSSKEIRNRLSLGNTSDLIEEIDLPYFSFSEIANATNNFSDSNILGKGGFGTVYKAMLGDKEVAVKRISKRSDQGAVEFRNEVLLIAKLQHRNLVNLLGYCIQQDEKLLIYEYLPNKSLDTFLFDAAQKSLLDWPRRFDIIKGIARGLLYLHQDSRLNIIHRDLKAGNVLLDAKMRPKISDFGTARLFDANEQQSNTNQVVGTMGYMAPEYALEGIISIKSDVYSFGVLLLEIVSGLKINSTGPFNGQTTCPHNLIAYVWSLWKDGIMRDFVDSSIVEGCSPNEILRCIHIGLLSVQGNPDARPSTMMVVSSLENEAIELPEPIEPVYFARNYKTSRAGENSRNTMSFTSMVMGR